MIGPMLIRTPTTNSAALIGHLIARVANAQSLRDLDAITFDDKSAPMWK
jgi:hypothetical protein